MKKTLSALTAAIVAVGIALVGVAAPASAHTAALTGVATCQTDGTYSITWTYHQTNTPASGTGSQADVTVADRAPSASLINGSSQTVWLNASSDPDHSNGGAIATRKGNWNQTFTQTKIAGSATAGTVKVHTEWLGWGSADSSGSVTLAGNCAAIPVKDATAVLTVSDPTCDSPAKLQLGHASKASWGTPTRKVGPGDYSVTATAISGHAFASGDATMNFTGSLADKLAANTPACVPPPACIPASAVSYTYDPTSNSGVITVNDIANSTGTLCAPFYVTATSWKYTRDDNVWPQTRDVVQKLDKITGPGIYPYSAPMHCGQGDIYASFDAQPDPTPTLVGPSNPFPEHFLQRMGFTGPTPTHYQQSLGCFTTVPATGTPVFETASCTPDSRNWATLPAVNGGVWTITKEGGAPVSIPIGTGFSNSPQDGYGAYAVTLTDGNAHDGYAVTSGSWAWNTVDVSTLDCRTVILVVPNGPTFVDKCGTANDSTTLPKDTDEFSYSTTVANGVTTVTATAKNGYVFPAGVMTTWNFTFTDEPCPVEIQPGDPTVTPQSCVAGSLSGGSISVALNDNLIYSISGGPDAISVNPVTGTVSGLKPGTYTVDVTAKPGYVLKGAESWPLEVQIGAAEECRTIETSAVVTPATCSADDLDASTLIPGSVTLGLDSDVIYKIDGVPATTNPTELAAGDHLITAELTASATAAGYALTTSSWNVHIDTLDCNLPTEAAWHAGAAAQAATCTTSGYITLEHLADEAGQVKYSIKNDATGAVQNAGATATKVNVAAGHYTVTAAATHAGDGISTASVFHLTVAAAAAACGLGGGGAGQLDTLAFTGVTAGLGLSLAAGMLVLGLAGIYMRRRILRDSK